MSGLKEVEGRNRGCTLRRWRGGGDTLDVKSGTLLTYAHGSSSHLDRDRLFFSIDWDGVWRGDTGIL